MVFLFFGGCLLGTLAFLFLNKSNDSGEEHLHDECEGVCDWDDFKVHADDFSGATNRKTKKPSVSAKKRYSGGLNSKARQRYISTSGWINNSFGD